MATLGEASDKYEPQQIKNIADLDSVNLSSEFFDEKRKKSDGSEYDISYIRVDGMEYRVPLSVLEQIKEIRKTKPKTTIIKVVKKGEGMKTTYTTVPMD